MSISAARKELAKAIRKNVDKLLKPLPEGQTSKSNVVKTTDLRVDIHQDSKDPDKATARIQANAQATDKGVKDYIKKGNKGSGSHKGTHKNIASIPFARSSFDIEDFVKDVEQK